MITSIITVYNKIVALSSRIPFCDFLIIALIHQTVTTVLKIGPSRVSHVLPRWHRIVATRSSLSAHCCYVSPALYPVELNFFNSASWAYCFCYPLLFSLGLSLDFHCLKIEALSWEVLLSRSCFLCLVTWCYHSNFVGSALLGYSLTKIRLLLAFGFVKTFLFACFCLVV